MHASQLPALAMNIFLFNWRGVTILILYSNLSKIISFDFDHLNKKQDQRFPQYFHFFQLASTCNNNIELKRHNQRSIKRTLLQCWRWGPLRVYQCHRITPKLPVSREYKFLEPPAIFGIYWAHGAFAMVCSLSPASNSLRQCRSWLSQMNADGK